jgi:glycosyltransferase involved in cell wall biosynthesis
MDKKIEIFVNMTVPHSLRYDGTTGSWVRLGAVFKHFKQLDEKIKFVFNTTEEIARYFRESGVEAQYKILPTNLKFSGYVGLCLKTFFLIAKSFFVFGIPQAKATKEKIVVYASSDLFWEVIPAFVWKFRNKNIEWVQIIHHIYPDWEKRLGSKIISFFGYYLQRLSLFLIRKKADKLILMNDSIRNELVLRGFEARKMHVLSNGIDFDYFEKVVRGADAYDGIFLGRLNASKGVSDFIPIWKKVCEKIPEARLAVIGGAEKKSKADFIQEIKENKLEKNIDVLGFLENAEAFALLKASKVFISPSHEEGWGIAIAEAMACGLPVVSWDLPVYKEIFENHTFQIKQYDADAFAGHVLRLLSDSRYREEIGKTGKEFIKKYSWEKVAGKELEIIQR